MERAALGLEPRASHPADQESTTHAEEGTGHRARTWNHTLNSHQSISNPVAHSMRATSRRTSPKQKWIKATARCRKQSCRPRKARAAQDGAPASGETALCRSSLATKPADRGPDGREHQGLSFHGPIPTAPFALFFDECMERCSIVLERRYGRPMYSWPDPSRSPSSRGSISLPPGQDTCGWRGHSRLEHLS
jgi:hypothetical protein